MRKLLTIAFVLIGSVALAQSSYLKEAISRLDKALIAKDTIALKQLLHPDLSFGHSSGWVETKQDVLNDVKSGKLNYKSLEHKDVRWTARKDWATVRSNTHVVSVNPDGNTSELNLHVLLVWLRTNKGWQLLARQTTRLPQN
jgi:ketosteroid isomerase-like protein